MTILIVITVSKVVIGLSDKTKSSRGFSVASTGSHADQNVRCTINVRLYVSVFVFNKLDNGL